MMDRRDARERDELSPELRVEDPLVWRERVLRVVFGAGALVSGVLSLMYALVRPTPRFDWLVAVLMAGAATALVLRKARWGFPVRAAAGVALTYLMASAGLVRVGFLAGPALALGCSVLLGGVLLGRRAALATLALTTATALGIGGLVSAGLLPPYDGKDADFTLMRNWVRNALSYAGVTGLIGTIFTYVLREAETNLAQATEALRRLHEAQRRREQMEAALAHAQKLEALGRLAGGVAHDFNNALTVIQGWGVLLQKRVNPTPAEIEATDGILQAARQAGELTRRLLSFARRGSAPPPRPLAIDSLLEQTARSLRRVLSEDILVTAHPGGVPAVLADDAQISQVLLNLAVNAGDAMPRGGRLDLSTRLVVPEELPPVAKPSDRPYVEILVRDDGVGMDAATRARLFEPFFTTKEPGRGTGLGLATSYGIVAAAGGYIIVTESAPGAGTTFAVGLPVAEAPRGLPDDGEISHETDA